MVFFDRIKSAGRVAGVHLVVSGVVAMLAAFLVFKIWYPHPYDELSGGRSLFLLLMGVDVVCGPVLTLVAFNPAKTKIKWRTDLIFIVLIQLAALAYGLHSIAKVRPVFLAFEGNRFQVVQADDFDPNNLYQAPPELAAVGFGGPRLIAIRLASPTDLDYPLSIQLSLQGLPPSFRPARWIPYETQRVQIVSELKTLAVLKSKNKTKIAEIDSAIAASGLSEDQLGYLPLLKDKVSDWVVIVERENALPKAFLHLDGW